VTVFARPGLTVVGHRGAGRAMAPAPGGPVRENTLASFAAAVAAGVDWVETDLQRTADGVVVCHHDPVLADGTPILSLGAADLPDWCPRLVDVLEAVPAQVGVIAEVKPVLADLFAPTGASTAAAAICVLAGERRRRPARPLLSYAFDPSMPKVLHALAAEHGVALPVGVVAGSGASLALITLAAAQFGVSIVAGHTDSFLAATGDVQHAPHTLEAIVAAGHRAGLQYMCWCPSDAQAETLLAAGVDAVCIDDVTVSSVAARLRAGHLLNAA
jgi:glycerophosphoryl diester phosphodiesterase